MEHRRAADIDWDAAPPEWFTGDVQFGPYTADGADGVVVLGVRFDAAARTDWHRHPEGQVLVVLDGDALVGTEDGTTLRASVGDVVYAPPGEVHWHGAAAETPMTHLSITHGGETEWTGAEVTDDQYSAGDTDSGRSDR